MITAKGLILNPKSAVQNLDPEDTQTGGAVGPSTGLVRFEYDDQRVRVVTDEFGDPWFVARDVAKILGYRDAEKLTRRLDKDEIGIPLSRGIAGGRPLATISESGLYSAILGSKVPEAKPFKRWVTHDVLPQIRKTGGYGVVEQPKELSRKELALMVVEAEEARERAELELAEARPKALAIDTFTAEAGEFTVGQAAKILDGAGIPMGRNRLFEELDDLGWIFPEGRKWVPYQRKIKAGLMTVHLESSWDDEIGEFVPGSAQIYITNKGLYQLRKHLAAEAA